jgi:hypothetical protein
VRAKGTFSFSNHERCGTYRGVQMLSMKESSDPNFVSEMNRARLKAEVRADNGNQKKSRMDKNT